MVMEQPLAVRGRASMGRAMSSAPRATNCAKLSVIISTTTAHTETAAVAEGRVRMICRVIATMGLLYAVSAISPRGTLSALPEDLRILTVRGQVVRTAETGRKWIDASSISESASLQFQLGAAGIGAMCEAKGPQARR